MPGVAKAEGGKMDRRSFVVGTVASAATLASVQSRGQDAYPTRTITMISPFPPGGVSDTITRPLDAALEAVFKQPVVLENKAGAAGAVGAQYVAAAKPDERCRQSCDFRIAPSDRCRSTPEIYQRGFHSTRADCRRPHRADHQQGLARNLKISSPTPRPIE